MKNTFDKAKQKNRPKRKEFKVRYKFFGEEFYVNPFLIPVAIVVGTAEYIDNKYYESLEWSDEKATKLLNRTLPYVLEWVEEEGYDLNYYNTYKEEPMSNEYEGIKGYLYLRRLDERVGDIGVRKFNVSRYMADYYVKSRVSEGK